MSDTEEAVPVPTPENPWRTPQYIAEATGYKAYTIREWLRDGKMKGHKVGPNEEWRVLHSDFVEFCQKRWGSN